MDKKVEFSEILNNIMRVKNLTYYRIAKDTDYSSPTVARYIAEENKSKPNFEFLNKFLEVYPDINPEYLLTGIGSILREVKEAVSNKTEYVELPYLSRKAQAEFKGKSLENIRFETYRFGDLSVDFGKSNIVFEVDGNSMSPTLSDSAKIICEIVDSSEFSYTTGIFVLLIGDNFFVKRIKNNDLKTTNFLTLHSDNKDYGTITVSNEDIRQIWKATNVCFMPLK